MKTFIEYVNVPQNRILSETNRDSFSFNILANKFEVIFYTLKTPKIIVDVSAYANDSNKVAILESAALESLIINQLDKNLQVRNISIKQLEIQLDIIDSKKVPVVLNTSINLKKGFDVIGTPRITPDSVVLNGPKIILDTIAEISTDLFTRDDLDASLNVTIPLKPIGSSDIQFVETSVLLEINIEEFSQKFLTVPVKLLNAPLDETIKIIPTTIKIDFTVSLSSFNEITANDFIVVCDYAKRNVDENFMIPEIIQQPEEIKNVELITKKIDYLLFK